MRADQHRTTTEASAESRFGAPARRGRRERRALGGGACGVAGGRFVRALAASRHVGVGPARSATPRVSGGGEGPGEDRGREGLFALGRKQDSLHARELLRGSESHCARLECLHSRLFRDMIPAHYCEMPALALG